MFNLELKQEDFAQEGPHQWVAHRDGYRYVIRKVDGAYEVVIRPEIENDPTPINWEDALKICNYHLQYKRIAHRHDADYKE